MAKRTQQRVLLFDAKGRFLSDRDRYTSRLARVMIKRGGRYVTVAKDSQTPSTLASVLSRTEFDSLAEAVSPIRTFKTRKKYAAWDLASQIDKIKGIRRKLLKFDIVVRDGDRKRVVSFYNVVKSNRERNFQIWKRINEALGASGYYTYDRVGSKILADRKGKKIKIESIALSQVL